MPPFHAPVFSLWTIVYTSIGAAIFWGKWGKAKLKAYVLSDLVNLLPCNQKWRGIIEFVIFVALGCLVGVAVVQPTNAAQALTAGLGWTGLVSKHRA